MWECRSRLARALVVQRGCLALQAGLLAWLRLLLLGIACLLGLAGCATALLRPAIERHAAARTDSRRRVARDRAVVRFACLSVPQGSTQSRRAVSSVG